MITVRHLTKTFTTPDGKPLPVLRDISCEIGDGEIVAIIGPSGSGKSTLLRTLNLLDPPTSGEIIVDGENILAKGFPVNKHREKMGMVFQNFNLFEHLTVLDNVTLAPMKLHGLSADEARKGPSSTSARWVWPRKPTCCRRSSPAARNSAPR